ncbi:MAG: hypothetical protein VCD34_05535, partial [Planctomycetota bacterium]
MKCSSFSIFILGTFCLAFCIPAMQGAETVLVQVEAEWKYVTGAQEASSPDPGAWRSLEFDDSAWTVSPAAFGYGEPELGTDFALLDPPMRRNYTSVFLRRTFEVAALEDLESYDLSALYDDGFIVWINGLEVLRVNMEGDPGDPVSIEDDALRSHEAREFEPFVITDIRNYVNAGTNQLAIQAFNVSPTSTDFKFDMTLVDPFGPDVTPPGILSRIPSPGSVVRRLGQVEISFDEPVSGVDASDLLVNGVPAEEVRGFDAGPYVFNFAQPPPGEVAFSWSADSAVTDRAAVPNGFQGESWTCRLDPDAPAEPVVISEFLASNRAGLRDEDGDSSDWIELHNEGETSVGLVGWSLS